MCGSRKYQIPIPSSWKVTGNSEGEGVLKARAKIKKISVEGVWYFLK